MAFGFRGFQLRGHRRVAVAGAVSSLLAAALLALVCAAPAGAHRWGHARPAHTPPAWSHSAWSGSRPPAPTSYLALGDSLAFGYSQARFDELFPEESPADFESGYVNVFGGVLKVFHPGLQIVNDGCPGETTESFVKGPCPYVAEGFALHHPYAGGPTSAQLSDALAYLRAHPGAVNPITLDIGANDALGLIGGCKEEPLCIAAGAPGVFGKIAANLGLILGDLRADAPRAQIIVLGLYNPFGETIAGGNALTAQLNEVEAKVAATVGARFVDPLPIFNPPGALEAPTICLLTNMCTPLKDIHPTALGYKVLGGLVLQQYLLGVRPLRP
ncbi:MAG TPA: SGNH/GDSL hydrolase family protein [Solirubrobacteraceae bacterium]|jgi:lysophospholipase L1-like esterase|nr:SGNH/GDSL hydrolase family protein [Solirubrobacteraceae bacterium]